MTITKRYYFLDQSCGEGFDVVFKRAQSFAAKALHLLDAADVEFARVFETIFKAPKTDTELLESPSDQVQRTIVEHVRRILFDLAYNWTPVQDRSRAEIRIHFDGLGRYEELYDGCFFDPVNFLVRYSSKSELEKSFEGATASVAWEQPVELRLTPDHPQHPNRVVIDFTELAVREEVPFSFWEKADLTDVLCDRIGDDLIEITILHELMHGHAYQLEDFPTENSETSGWKYLMGLTKNQTFRCAESIAMLCLAAALATIKPVHGDGHTISNDGRVVPYHDMSDWDFLED